LRARSFAYVTYASPSAAEAALKFNGVDIGGRPAKVEPQRPKEARASPCA
jgi:RNA recognition motif-containing protein